MPPLILVSGDTMSANFVTDSGGERQGFHATYYGDFCESLDATMMLHTLKTNKNFPPITTHYYDRDNKNCMV